MSGKHLTTKQVTEAITLREAGFTLTSIAEKIGVSVSSLQRSFKKHSVKKASLRVKAVEKAREDLLSRVTSSESIKHEAAKLVCDDLAHSTLLREKAALTIESLNATDTAEAALSMRALVAYSTLLKNTSDTIRRGLGIDKSDMGESIEDLPDLTISEMTADDIEAITKAYHADKAA